MTGLRASRESAMASVRERATSFIWLRLKHVILPVVALVMPPVGVYSSATASVCPKMTPTWTNIAPEATITVSSVNGSAVGCRAVDGRIGLPNSEWVSSQSMPEIQLTWATNHTITSIDLYDSLDPIYNNVASGELTFSDGSRIPVPAIAGNGALTTITFQTPKTIFWVKFTVTTSTGSDNGLAEIAVGEVPPVTRPYLHSEQVNLVFWPGTRLTTNNKYDLKPLSTKFGDTENNYRHYPDETWIQLDLGVGHIQTITGVRLRFRDANWVAAAYEIWVGNDGVVMANNTLVADVPNEGGAMIINKTFASPVAGRHVRVKLRTAKNVTKLCDGTDVIAPSDGECVWVDGLSVFSSDPKQVNLEYPINEEESGGAQLEPLKGWGWYHATKKPSNLISGAPVATAGVDDRDDSNTRLDMLFEGAMFRIKLDGTYALEKMLLGTAKFDSLHAIKVELSVDDINYHTVFAQTIPHGYVNTVSWSTANNNGDAKYVRVTLPAMLAVNTDTTKVLSRLELFGLPVTHTAVIPDALPAGYQQVGTFDVPNDGYLSAGIYDSSGQLVRTLKNREPVTAGARRPIYWDHKDHFGNLLPVGTYGWKTVVTAGTSRDDGNLGNSGNPSHGLTNAYRLAVPVAFDTVGNLYTASSWEEPHQELRRYKSDGTPEWGVSATHSYGIATDGQFIFVARDTSGNVIQRYRASDGVTDLLLYPLIKVNPAPPPPVPSAQIRASKDEERWSAGVNGLAVDGTHLWVSNYRNSTVECYNKPDGAPIGSFQITKPLGIAVGNGFFWVVRDGSRVTRFDVADACPPVTSAVTPATAFEVPVGQGADPYSLSLKPGGSQLFITENGLGRVSVYNTATGVITTRGQPATPGPLGPSDFRLGARAGVAVDALGRYVVADVGNYRLQWFLPNGTLWQSMSSEFQSAPFVDESGTRPDLVLSGPRQFTVSPEGTWRYTHNWTPSDDAFYDETSRRRRLQVGTENGKPVYRDYLFFTKSDFRGGIVVYLLDHDDRGMRRAAALGSGWTGQDDNSRSPSGCYSWIDKNGDGIIEWPAPTPPSPTPPSWAPEFSVPARCFTGATNVWISEKGDQWLQGPSPDGHGAVVIPLLGFDARYNPIYNFDSARVVFPLDASTTSYTPIVNRPIPGGNRFLTLGHTANSPLTHGASLPDHGSGDVVTLHNANGSIRVRVNLHEEYKAWTIAADGLYWYTGNSRGDQHWVNMYDENGLLIATMRPGSPSNWGSGWMDHAASMSVRHDSSSYTHYAYAEDVNWGRIIRYATVLKPGDLSRDSGAVHGTPVWAQGEDMQPGEVLNPGQSIYSRNGLYYLAYQGEGNLVLYKSAGGWLWASGTQGKPGSVCIMQSDGNLVIYDRGGLPIWSSQTGQHAGSRLEVTDDGHVVISSPAGTPLWTKP
jgi:hypothetical protein